MRTIYEKQIHVAELLQKPSVLSLRYRKYFDKTIACFGNYLNYWGIWTIPDCNVCYRPCKGFMDSQGC